MGEGERECACVCVSECVNGCVCVCVYAARFFCLPLLAWRCCFHALITIACAAAPSQPRAEEAPFTSERDPARLPGVN